MEPFKVVVFVRGGIVVGARANANCEMHVIDYDNAPEDYTDEQGNSLKTWEEVEEAINISTFQIPIL